MNYVFIFVATVLEVPFSVLKTGCHNTFAHIVCVQAEPILPIRRIRTLHRAPETPEGPLALKDVLILVSFLILASGSENMNDRFF